MIRKILFFITIFFLNSLFLDQSLFAQFNENAISAERFIYTSESSIDMYNNLNNLLELNDLYKTKGIYFDFMFFSSDDKKYTIPVDYSVPALTSMYPATADVSNLKSDLYLCYSFSDLKLSAFLIYSSMDLTYTYPHSGNTRIWSYEKFLYGLGVESNNISLYSSIITTTMPLLSKNNDDEYLFTIASDNSTNTKATTEGYYFIVDAFDFSNNLIVNTDGEVKLLNLKKHQYSFYFFDDLALSMNYVANNNAYQPGIEVFIRDLLNTLTIHFNAYANLHEHTDENKNSYFAHSILKLSTFRGYWKQGEIDTNSESCDSISHLFYLNLYLSYSRDLYNINLFGYNFSLGVYSSEFGTLNFEAGVSRNYYEHLLTFPLIGEYVLYGNFTLVY